MSQGVSIWAVILLALAAANLPFLNERLFAVVPLAGGGKSLAVRLAELVLLYFVVGGVGLLLEQRVGRIAPQGWEFYAVTGSLFVVLAFPGFIWRYLRRQPRAH